MDIRDSVLCRILPEVSIKTYHQNESPRVQRQEKNYKEHKLRCTTYSTEGECVASWLKVIRGRG